ncbi:MAG: biotin--[acetyl-CoA-carboxylase] ligase [Rhodoferax sp.]
MSHLTPPLVWPAESLWERIAPQLPGFTVEIVPSIDSTNSELMRRAHGGRSEPVLLVAEAQTQGRGRMGRQWDSQAGVPGAALTFSLGLPLATQDWSGLSLVVGLSLATHLHPGLRLKWPNDLWWQQRKLGGVLIETASVGSQRYAVIGVGLNLRARASEGLATPAAWWDEVAPGGSAPALLAQVLPALVADVQRFEAEGFAPFQSAFAARDVLQGRSVQCSDGRVGEVLGVDAHGALLLRTAQGVERVTSAEVSVRAQQGPA